MEYPLYNINGLLLFLDNDSYYLLDTSSPYSYVNKNSILINDKEYTNSYYKSVLSDRCKKLSNILKKNVDGIIGLDIISNEGLFIDKKNNIVKFESKVLDGTIFEFDYYNKDNSKYMILELDVLGLQSYGNKKFIFDTGIELSLFSLDTCIHSQYAYRKNIYYLSLDINNELDFVFNEIKQKDNKLELEVGIANKTLYQEQLDLVNVDGLLSLNNSFKDYLVIDIKNKKIILK